jgi:hypothetical protein
MGWELRKGKPYYYRKERRNGRVISVYCGSGEHARLWAGLARLDQERRQYEAVERQIARSEWAELAAVPEELTQVLAEARRQARAALEAAGYHQHKRQWRKRRGKNSEARESPDP